GVLNIVQGEGAAAGQALVDHPRVRAISLTGSTAVGARIAASVAPRFRKLSLELGGKNPSIVFADAPRERLYDTLLRASFQNAGQICLCGSRILVEKAFYEEFRDAFVERTRALVVGDPQDPRTQVGPLVSEAHYRKVLGCLDTARGEGGRVLCGGGPVSVGGRCEHGRLRAPARHRGVGREAHYRKVLGCLDTARGEGGRVLCGGGPVSVGGRCEHGWFVAPTVIEGLGPECRSNREEIFGPVVSLQPFDDAEHALALANAAP